MRLLCLDCFEIVVGLGKKKSTKFLIVLSLWSPSPVMNFKTFFYLHRFHDMLFFNDTWFSGRGQRKKVLYLRHPIFGLKQV